MTRVLVIGDGRMGRSVAQVAAERGCDVIDMYGPAEMEHAIPRGTADVAIEFTQPDAAPQNVRACLAAGIPVVCGTTGWDAELEAVGEEARKAGGAFLHSPNFSIGVALFSRVVESAARMSAGRFDSHIVETHHAAKLDAPSGTAKMLARLASGAAGKDIPVTSVRVGSVPGTHELVLDAPFEQIRLVHEARDRRVFADGAVAAAKWLAGKKTGVFTFADFVNATIEA
jgi:4-hydroxy-tetrahydrodipicolinate reductase